MLELNLLATSSQGILMKRFSKLRGRELDSVATIIGAVSLVSLVALAAEAAAPTSVRAIPGNGIVTLVWNHVTGGTSFAVYRSTTSGNTGTTPYVSSVIPAAPPPVSTVKVASDAQLFVDYADKNVTNGTTYYYQIATGSETARSAEISATPVAASNAITKSRFLKIMPLGNSITSGWDGPNNMGGYRWALIDSLRNSNYNFLLVGSYTKQSDGMELPPTSDPFHEGWNNREISDLTHGVVDRAIPNYDPDIVMLEIGTNDFNNGSVPAAQKDVPKFLRMFDTLALKIYSYKPAAYLIVIPVPQWCFYQSETAAMGPKIVQYNAGLKNLVAGYVQQGRRAIYMSELEDVKTDATVGGDCLHPPTSEYKRMAAVLFAAIKSITDATLTVPSTQASPRSDGIRFEARKGTIYISGTMQRALSIDVFTLAGGLVKVIEVPASRGEAHETIPIRPGAYVVTARTKETQGMSRIMLVR